MPTLDREHITGLVLAGGRGRRMGGADKGLQPWRGRPLAQHVLDRLRPQVGTLAVNANRHADEYAALGVPVWPDTVPGQPGPLAGLLAGLLHCTTPWLASAPCDSPLLPPDLVARLAAGLQAAGSALAIAVTLDQGERRRHPVFCLVARSLHESLADALRRGHHRVDDWARAQGAAEVLFDDARAFTNTNTADDLRRLDTP